jgi:hypothetical protein
MRTILALLLTCLCLAGCAGTEYGPFKVVLEGDVEPDDVFLMKMSSLSGFGHGGATVYYAQKGVTSRAHPGLLPRGMLTPERNASITQEVIVTHPLYGVFRGTVRLQPEQSRSQEPIVIHVQVLRLDAFLEAQRRHLLQQNPDFFTHLPRELEARVWAGPGRFADYYRYFCSQGDFDTVRTTAAKMIEQTNAYLASHGRTREMTTAAQYLNDLRSQMKECAGL